MPEYDGVNNIKTSPISIPRTGYGWIYMLLSGSCLEDGTLTPTTELSPLCRCYINGNIILSCSGVGRAEIFFPVNAGDWFYFGTGVRGVGESVYVTPNTQSHNIRFVLYDIQNKSN